MSRNQFFMGGYSLRKDSEKLLSIVLERRENTGSDEVHMNLDDFSSVPNISSNIKAILDELKRNDCISWDSNYCITGEIDIGLTQDGIDYFVDKKNREIEADSINMTIINGSVSGSQIQQGSANCIQSMGDIRIDYDLIKQLTEKIQKYEKCFDKEFGDNSGLVREKNIRNREIGYFER